MIVLCVGSTPCQSFEHALILSFPFALQAASGELHNGPEVLNTNPLDVMELFPANFKPRSNVDSKVHVAPLPADLQDRLVSVLKPEELKSVLTATKEDVDLASLLTQVHLQRLHTRFLSPHWEDSSEAGPSTSTETQGGHPLWAKAEEIIAQQPKGKDGAPSLSPSGISRTITEHIGEYATNVKLLWEGAIYKKLIEYLTRIILRLHLAPQREQKFKNKANAVAKAKQGKKDDPSHQSGSDSKSLLKSKVMKLCNELSVVEGMAISPRRFKRIRGIVAQLHQLAMPTKVPPADATGSDEYMGDEIMDWLSRDPELDLDDLDSCEDPDEVDDDDDAGKCNNEYQKDLLNGNNK